MARASEDPEIRCIVVTGADGNFSSGADLKAMSGDAGNEDPEIDVQARMAEDPDLVMKALPLGVFGLMAKVVATTGFDKVSSILWFVVTDLLGMLILVLIAYPLAI